MQLRRRKYTFVILSLLIGGRFGEVRAQPAPPATNKGTITLLTGFGAQGYDEPGPLVEVSPGKFVGVAVSDDAVAFTLTSQGAVSTLYTFPLNAGPGQTVVQAINGRVYGTENSGNFSL